MKNFSPWLEQLNKDRPISSLKEDKKTDIVIVGGGIAGISTAFYLMKNTSRKVVLVEGKRLGHGATGHNAGQITTYFEKSFHQLVEEFGLALAAQGQKDIENSWKLLEEMYSEAGLNIPLSKFNGHLGLSSKTQIISFLEDNFLRKKAGIKTEDFLISENIEFLNELDKYESLFKLVSHTEILEKLETSKKDFIAVVSAQKGCMNSALFTEEVASYLINKYKDRFEIYEDTLVDKIILHNENCLLDTGIHTLECGNIILCTNGFENLRIFNKSGLDIDTSFHHALHGTVGYMSGYLERLNKSPIAISYFTDPDSSSVDPYFYLTRREFEHKDKIKHNLISVGGPEVDLEDRSSYNREEEYPEDAINKINSFVKEVYETDPNKKIEYIFTWHGLMGYTPSGVRLIGVEPKNPLLLYNLGCNGVGILPSIFGGEKISRIIKGEVTENSIFDPK